ncbi:MAG: pyridine nucleotide-disulfide oxidoreductase [Lysobacterales bacterium]|nr:MAG: pyridine nucleotide-disulfide oxidoreductase [Xanthomonadales bacterium]
MSEHLVIVGGGQAAAQAVQSLRQQSFSGEITLLCDEPYPPYQRPPLSKKYFAGELTRERLLLRPAAFYAEKGVVLEQNARVEELEPTAHRVRLRDGRTLVYDRLLLATGSRVRTLAVPGADLAGLHYFRTIADVDAITASLAPGARVLLVGAGYIGLEVAAVARQRGFDVTVLEAADRVMSRTVSAEVSAFYEGCHRAAGVAIHCGAGVKALHGTTRVTAVETTDGRTFPCDVAIVGIGIVPNVEIAAAAGMACDNGIVVDELARTADPHIVAAGDCTNHPHPLLERRVRLESVPNAVHQAKVAAATLLGTPTAYSEVPWFWSDQYDLKLQIAGLSSGYDEVVLRGDPAKRSFAAFYLRAGQLLAVDAVNSPREFIAGKKLVANRARIAPDVLRDATIDLSSLAG